MFHLMTIIITLIMRIWFDDTVTVSHYTKCNIGPTNSTVRVRALSCIRDTKYMCFQVFCKRVPTNILENLDSIGETFQLQTAAGTSHIEKFMPRSIR